MPLFEGIVPNAMMYMKCDVGYTAACLVIQLWIYVSKLAVFTRYAHCTYHYENEANFSTKAVKTIVNLYMIRQIDIQNLLLLRSFHIR